MILCCVSAENVKRNHNLQKSGRIVELLTASRHQNIVTSTTSLGSQSCSSGGFTLDTPRFSKCRRCSRTCIRISSKAGSSSCRCTTTLTGTRIAMKRYANKIQLVLHPMPHFSRKDDALFSNQEMEYDGMGAILTSQMGSGTPLQKTLLTFFEEEGHPVLRCSILFLTGVC